jgi:hypothetical protein
MFAAHPVHVEAVVGIVGRAEVLCACFYCGALLSYLACVREVSASGSAWTVRRVAPLCFLSAVLSFIHSVRVCVSAVTRLCSGRLCSTLLNSVLDRTVPSQTHSASTFASSLLFATLAVFSKENGITCIAAFVIIDFVVDRPDAGAKPWTTPRRGVLARGALVALWVAVVMAYRVSVHGGAPLYKWTLLENQFSLMPRVRVMSYRSCLVGASCPVVT